jgi:hypothetical protein
MRDLSAKELEAVGLVLIGSNDMGHPHDLNVEGRSVINIILASLDAPVDEVEPLVVSVQGLLGESFIIAIVVRIKESER